MELTEYKDTQLDRTDPNSIISKIQGATKIEEALARVFVSKEYSELRSEREFKVEYVDQLISTTILKMIYT